MMEVLPSSIWLVTFSATSGCSARILVGVLVAAVDHDVGADTRFIECVLTGGNVDGVVIGFAVTAAKHHVSIFVTGSTDSSDMATGINTEKVVWYLRRI